MFDCRRGLFILIVLLVIQKNGTLRIAFGLTEPKHGSDANWMETRAVKDTKTGEWVINGAKMWNSGMQWVI
jgi:acyl-CoA dehydrogenase